MNNINVNNPINTNYDMRTSPNAINSACVNQPSNFNSEFINFAELKIENSEVRWSGFISKKGEKIQCDCRQIWGAH